MLGPNEHFWPVELLERKPTGYSDIITGMGVSGLAHDRFDPNARANAFKVIFRVIF